MQEMITRMLKAHGASVRYCAPAADNPSEYEIEFWGAGKASQAEDLLGPALETQDDGRFGWWPLASVQAAIHSAARVAAASSVAWALAQNAAARADAVRQAEVDFARAAGLPVVSCARCGLDWAGPGYGHQAAYCAACHASMGGAVERVNAALAEHAQTPAGRHMRATFTETDGPPRHGFADSGLGGVQGVRWD